MINISKLKIILSVLILGSMLISSCSAIRKVTYPPDFVYLEHKTVTNSMQGFAISIDKIDQTIQQIVITPSSTQRSIIINELNNMEKISDTLGDGTQNTNHLFIDRHIDQFRTDVINARKSIESNQSNYYQAGKLVGSCMSCHIMRSENWILQSNSE